MRFLASGDHHFFARHRFRECIRVHEWMVDLARDVKPDVFLSGGDVYEAASVPIEREAAAEWTKRMAEVSPLVFAKGNHDRRLDCAILARLRTRHPVIVEEAARVHRLGGAAIAAMAWPERHHLLSEAGCIEGADTLMRDALQAVLRGLGDELESHDGPRILLGHFMCDGAQASNGQPLIGMLINVSLAELSLARAHIGVMAHIHMVQGWDVAGAPHRYTGSPYRTDYGQLEKKSVLMFEFDGQRLTHLEEIETPCTPMLHVEALWDDGFCAANEGTASMAAAEQAARRGAEIRFRYHVRAQHREAASAAAHAFADELRGHGAVDVKVEDQVISERRARAPEVARAKSLNEKLSAHWQSVNFDPGERRGAILAKAGALETELHKVA
ncbi:MAG: metallophosphoesterase family protein [Myxococcota bacterium]